VTPTPTDTPTPLPTPTQPPCTGDCNGDREVTVDELVVGIDIAGETLSLDACAAFDADDGGSVSIDELVAGVGNALGECRGRGAGVSGQ
jgi:hypothetical protein